MPVRRDTKTGRWFFRTWLTFPDGKRDRIFGTPGVTGPYHDLPNTKIGALEAERRAISKAMTGQIVRPAAAREVPTIRGYVAPFMDGYAAAHKPSSNRDKRQRLDAYILPEIGDVRLDELRQEHVDSIVAGMLDDDASRKTVNNTTSVLSALVGYAVANRVIADPKLRYFIKAQQSAMEAVAAADVDRLLAATGDRRYRVGILLAADAGLRIGEIRALPWLEINEIGREIGIASSYDPTNALTETKGWKRRAVPISDRLWSELRTIPRRGPLVFSRLNGKPIGYYAVRKVIVATYERAGVKQPRAPWHALRHTFGTELARSGVEIQTIRELMGHESIETTMRYMHTDRQRKRDAIARLGGQPAGRDSKIASQPTEN